MPITNITYDGNIISSTNQTEPINVTYNNSIITSITSGFKKTLNCNGKYMKTNVTVGNKTLNCANKMMASDVVIEVESSGPSKGQIITMNLDGTNRKYRILKIDGTVARVLGMFSPSSYSAYTVPPYNYTNSEVETQLKDWYDSLLSTAKSAIIPQTIDIDSWIFGSDAPSPKYYCTYLYDGSLVTSTGGVNNPKAEPSIVRSVYALSLFEIFDYLNVTSNMTPETTTWTADSVREMVWADSTISGRNMAIRSIYWTDFGGYYPLVLDDQTGINIAAWGYSIVYPAFTIDLSKISWS